MEVVQPCNPEVNQASDLHTEVLRTPMHSKDEVLDVQEAKGTFLMHVGNGFDAIDSLSVTDDFL